jgi:hypothetical protein
VSRQNNIKGINLYLQPYWIFLKHLIYIGRKPFAQTKMRQAKLYAQTKIMGNRSERGEEAKQERRKYRGNKG